MSASSCASIKGLALWISGHLVSTKIQGAELYSASIFKVSLDLTSWELPADSKWPPAQTSSLAGHSTLARPCHHVKHIFDDT